MPNEKIETNGDLTDLKQFKDEQDENKQDLEENQLKRKCSISDVDKTTKHKIIKIEDTLPDWHEDNLQLVNNMLNKINNHESTKQNDLKLLCENIKEKLEKNAYECLDDLNQDLKGINSTEKLFNEANDGLRLNSESIQSLN